MGKKRDTHQFPTKTAGQEQNKRKGTLQIEILIVKGKPSTTCSGHGPVRVTDIKPQNVVEHVALIELPEFRGPIDCAAASLVHGILDINAIASRPR